MVSRRRPDPSAAPERVVTLRGFFGESDREGVHRLYFTRDLDFYAEFRVEDAVDLVEIPPDQAPFLGEKATEVTLREDATVEFTRTQVAKAPDAFDLDVRLAQRRRSGVYARRTSRNRWSAGWTDCCLPYTVDDPTCAPTCNDVEWTCAVACWTLVGCGPDEGITFVPGGDTGPHNSQCPPCFPL